MRSTRANDPIRLTLSAFLACLVVVPALRAAEPITPDRFSNLHALIKPAGAESKWTQIPWLASLWEARTKAAAEGKPILLWEMDGHPLGCV